MGGATEEDANTSLERVAGGKAVRRHDTWLSLTQYCAGLPFGSLKLPDPLLVVLRGVNDGAETAKNGLLGSTLPRGPRDVSREKPRDTPFLASSERDRRIRIGQLNVMEKILLRRLFWGLTNHSHGVLWTSRLARACLTVGHASR